MTTYIPLGWRCSTTVLCDKLGELPSFAFRGMYSKMEGVIDCFEFNFKNYFPNPNDFILLNSNPETPHQEKLWVFCETLKNASDNPQRIAFNNKFFCWFYYDLRNVEILQNMRKRIEKMYDYLSKTNDRVIFIRSVLDKKDIEIVNKFRNIINKTFPKLDWHILFLHDQHENKNIAEPHVIHKNTYTFINAPTHPMRPDIAFDLIKDLGDFKNLTFDQDLPLIHQSTLKQKIFFKNANIT